MSDLNLLLEALGSGSSLALIALIVYWMKSNRQPSIEEIVSRVARLLPQRTSQPVDCPGVIHIEKLVPHVERLADQMEGVSRQQERLAERMEELSRQQEKTANAVEMVTTTIRYEHKALQKEHKALVKQQETVLECLKVLETA